MAMNLRERFGTKGELPRSVVTGDFRFVPTEFATLRDYRIEHEEVDVVEKPLAIDRWYLLTHGVDSLQLEVALCLEGAVAAAELLFRRLEAYQREPAAEALRDLTASGIGDLGVAWSWDAKERTGVAGFVRHNVVAILQGRYDTLLDQARELDAALARIPAGDGPSEIAEPSFELGGRESSLRVASGGRVDLGLPARPGDQYFFLAAGGSVNRDPKEPTRRYFRAGLGKGQHLVTVLRVGAGLLPARQTIRITIE
ncbi:MAG: hypothetical protein ABI877_14510 [Gemmatimonadaceae bacterium]